MKLADDPELFKISYTGDDHIALTNFKIEAFTVAGVSSYELEEKLKQLAVDLREGKHPLAKDEKDIKKIWVAEAHNIIADYIPVKDAPPPNYLNTNLRTATQSSYHAAQYIRLQDDSVRDLYPAYQYKTLKDNRVREEHRILHDRIWLNNDPVWDKIWPPNGWNCRCYIKPLNKDETNNSAVQPKTSSDEQLNSIVGEATIGKDFQRNSGKSRSIWGKWKDVKLKEKNWTEIFQRAWEFDRRVSRLLEKEQLTSLLEENAEPFRELVYSKEVWEEEFPGDKVQTIFGDEAIFKPVKVEGKLVSQFEKLKIMGRDEHIGLIKPTLKKPLFVILDKFKGLIFLKPFRRDKRIDFASIGFAKGDIIEIVSIHEKNKFEELLNKFKTGEVLHFKALSTTGKTDFSRWNTPPSQSEIFEHDKLKFSFDIRNTKIIAEIMNEGMARNIMLNAEEIWGETYNYNGIVNSELNFIRYRVEGFQLVRVNNNEAYEIKFVGYDKIDEFRKGVVLL